MEFGCERWAGAVSLGAYFLLLPPRKERGGHGAVSKAEQ